MKLGSLLLIVFVFCIKCEAQSDIAERQDASKEEIEIRIRQNKDVVCQSDFHTYKLFVTITNLSNDTFLVSSIAPIINQIGFDLLYRFGEDIRPNGCEEPILMDYSRYDTLLSGESINLVASPFHSCRPTPKIGKIGVILSYLTFNRSSYMGVHYIYSNELTLYVTDK